MAGQGYKLFNTGDVLTAQQVNEYLMQQTVMVFANAAARTTALSGILAEGLVSYLKDTDVVEIYTGAAWVSLDDPNAIQNSIIDAKGDLIVGTADNTPARLASSGSNGQVLTVDTSTSTGLKWATPSTSLTWTRRKDANGNTFNSIAGNGSGTYVAVGDAGVLYNSTDNGATWTSRTSGFGSNNIQRVAYGNNLWVAVGNNGTITTSTDTVTWTARTANMSTNLIYDVIYANSTWVAVGAGGGTTNTGGITYSTDGITWTRKSQSLTVGDSYFSITWNGTNYIVGATISTNNVLYASSASGTWTAISVGGASPGAIAYVYYDGTRTYLNTQNNNLQFSTSATIASTTTVGNLSFGYNGNAKRYLSVANGILYYGRQWIYGYNLTPVNTQYLNLSLPATISPTSYSTNFDTSLTNSVSVLYADSNGIFISDGFGAIFTSF